LQDLGGSNNTWKNYDVLYNVLGVIIFGSVRFLSKKVTKPVFF
jgi:hypothetical protein